MCVLFPLYTYTHCTVLAIDLSNNIYTHNYDVPCITSLLQNVEVKDFRGSWFDGMAFCAIIHSFLPDKVPYDDLSPSNPRENFTIAFEAAKYVLWYLLLERMPSYYFKTTTLFWNTIINQNYHVI